MFVELHAQSAFSFLEGTEQPETLVAEAARLGMPTLALIDRDGLYGPPRLPRPTRRDLRALELLRRGPAPFRSRGGADARRAGGAGPGGARTPRRHEPAALRAAGRRGRRRRVHVHPGKDRSRSRRPPAGGERRAP